MNDTTNQTCPCGGCVTCSCAAIPKMDEDGLCAVCGGQPLLLALLDGPAPDPHVGTGVEGDDRTEIEAIIAGGIAPSDLAPYLTAIEARADGGPDTDEIHRVADALACVVEEYDSIACGDAVGLLKALAEMPREKAALVARVRELEAERDGVAAAARERCADAVREMKEAFPAGSEERNALAGAVLTIRALT